jgi:hypothetical protein
MPSCSLVVVMAETDEQVVVKQAMQQEQAMQ